MVPLKAYLISLGPPSPQLIKYIVTFLLACWGWNMLFGRRHWAAKGKHCIITGGSQGLGLALAALLLEKGAHVTIIARTESKLAAAVEELKAGADDKSLAVNYVAADLSSSAGAQAAIEQAIARKPFNGEMAGAVFMCAGVSMPGNFLTQPDADFTSTMDQVYYTSLWVARAASRLHLLAPKAIRSSADRPKLVFTASILSFMSFAGYASYSPSKYALRGLADSLRNELQWLGVDVHTFFPTGIKSPGFDVEEARKPALCKTIEGSDLPISASECAQHLLTGVEKGRYNITYDLAASIFRASSRGMAPYNNVFYDVLLAFIGSFGVPIWRKWADAQVRGKKADLEKESRAALAAQGFAGATAR